MRPGVLLLSGVLGFALTACGTTVSDTVAAGAEDELTVGTGLGLASGGAPGEAGSGSTAGDPTSPQGVPTGGGQGPAGTTGASGQGTGTGTGTGTGPAGRSTAPIRIGLLNLNGVDTFANALGISGLTTGDAPAQAKAVASYLNKHGGLGGRPIELRTANVAAAESGNETAWAAACTSLTEDQHVSYVVSYATLNETRIACYAKHGVPVLNDQSGVSDSVGAKYADYFMAPGEFAPGRSAVDLVDALWRMGWLTAKSKVGTFVYDEPSGVEFETRYLKPALARHGLSVAASARASRTVNGANQSGTVLKFRSAGVDRVIPLGASPLFLMQAAESQGYRPQYAMTSLFGPGALLESAAPPAQLRGAKGIGWSRFLDIGAGNRPGPVSKNESLCFDIMEKADQQSTSAAVKSFQSALCNVFFVLKAGADRHSLTPQLFSTLRAARFSPLPADTYRIQLAPGRADGAAAYRDLAYDGGCGCFQYTSGLRPAR